MTKQRARVGLVGLGLEAYWPQFVGLEQRLKGYVDQVATKMGESGVEVVNLGLIDTSQKGMAAGHRLRREDVDLLLIYATTYALSCTVLPMVQRAKVPVILLNLQPEAAIDYASFNRLKDRTAMTGEWLAYCSACPIPEIANVLRRAGIGFHQVTGMLENDPECWREIADWMQAANVVQALAHNRVGLMGHYYSGMMDIVTDLTAVCARFGGHFEMLEVDMLSRMREVVRDEEVVTRVREMEAYFDVQADCSAFEMKRAARTSVALDRMAAENQLSSMAYFYSGSGNAANEDTMSSIILGTSLMTARGIPVAGEYEVKNVLAMKIMDELGAGGSFTEFYAMDFTDDVVLMGHDGPGHIGIAEGKCKVRPLEVYHGKVGSGLSVEMSVRYGPVSILSVVEDGAGNFLLLIAEGECEPGPTLEIGNTNSRFRFSLGARGFMNAWNGHGPAHHCATGLGHVADRLEKIAALLGIKAVKVC
jgi:L-arabinose isomerase